MEEEVIFKIEIAPESITSIENLAKANKELREERKKLNLTTEEGKRRAQEINKQLDENTEIIKENSSALEKQRLNVGNYTGALDKLIPGLGATANGFGGMTSAAKAFIATPIGAVIGALGLAIGALTAYFKGSEEGQNNFNKIVKTTTVIIGNLLDVVRDFGGALFKFATGDLKGAWESLKEAGEGAKNIISETRAEIEKGLAIENLRAETDLLERSLIVLRAKNEAEIANLKLQAEDKSLSRQEREEALNKALELQNELSDKSVQVAKNRLLIKQEENALSDSTKEDLDEEAELNAKLLLVEKDRADKSKEIVTKKQALTQESIALLEKERDAIVAAHNAEIMREADAIINAAAQEERHQRELEKINERVQAFVSQEEALARRIAQLDLESDLVDEATQANIEYTAEVKKGTKAKLEQAKAEADNATNLASASALAVQVAGKNKGVASGATLINTYLSAQKAYASQIIPGDPTSLVRAIVAAAITTAGGLARVAAINGIGFYDGGLVGYAQGGLSGTRIMGHHGRPINRSNGDDRLATVKTGEVILNQYQQARLGGAATFRAIGVPGFASGGVTGVIPATAQRAEAASAQRQLFDSISNMKFFVAVTDINEGQNRVQAIEDRAQVI